MPKKDLRLIVIIGAAVGFLIQPVVDNLIRGSQTFASFIGSHELTPVIRATVFFVFLLLAPLLLWIAHILNRVWLTIYQFAKFAAVGTLNTFINFGVLNLQSLFTGITAGPYIPVFASVSFLASTTNSFFWNKYWTFDAQSKPEMGQTAKFYLVSLGGWAASVGIDSFVINYLRPVSVPPQLWLNVGALVGVVAVLFWNFVGYKYIVFKKPDVSQVVP